jgi:hypothetical protein
MLDLGASSPRGEWYPRAVRRRLPGTLAIWVTILGAATLWVPLRYTSWESQHGGIGTRMRHGFTYGWIWNHWSVQPTLREPPDNHDIQDREINWQFLRLSWLALFLFGGLFTLNAYFKDLQARKDLAEPGPNS